MTMRFDSGRSGVPSPDITCACFSRNGCRPYASRSSGERGSDALALQGRSSASTRWPMEIVAPKAGRERRAVKTLLVWTRSLRRASGWRRRRACAMYVSVLQGPGLRLSPSNATLVRSESWCRELSLEPKGGVESPRPTKSWPPKLLDHSQGSKPSNGLPAVTLRGRLRKTAISQSQERSGSSRGELKRLSVLD